jgi:Na+/H+ antiporter NhaD/arsenite permease-like protein
MTVRPMFSRIQNPTLAAVCLLWFLLSPVTEAAPLQEKETTTQAQPSGTLEEAEKLGPAIAATGSHHTQSPASIPPAWLAIPFVVLLLMIATGPLLYAKFWHQHYPKVAVSLAVLVLTYYLLVLNDWTKPVAAFMEYVQFIALIAALYMVSGGILIAVNKRATPLTNLGLLFTGAIIANLIGTTGASMLLIRPYMRLNQGRVKVYHIVFFIFIVSNVGGVLTPIGDPPLFLGFLSGVPFFWTLQHNLMPWLVALLLLGTAFYCVDARSVSNIEQVSIDPTKPALYLVGKHNFIWFAVIIGAVFIDPNLFDGVPALYYNQHSFSFVRELILFAVAWLSYRCADRHALQENAFSLAPLKEVVMLFVGIFGTMIPALQLISAFASSETGHAIITHNTLYWGAGLFSSLLDNAPTYLNFGAASMAAHGADITAVADVKAFAAGGVFTNSVLQLKAISIASVFFGAMTYIGNGPNFMVKAIAEHLGLRMPSFFTYILRFSVPILLPVLIIVWLLFFASL